VLSRSQKMVVTQRYVKDLTIRTPNLSQIVNNLSGGNQQKVVVAKWLFCDSKILIFDEPTRGIDVGTQRHQVTKFSKFSFVSSCLGGLFSKEGGLWKSVLYSVNVG